MVMMRRVFCHHVAFPFGRRQERFIVHCRSGMAHMSLPPATFVCGHTCRVGKGLPIHCPPSPWFLNNITIPPHPPVV